MKINKFSLKKKCFFISLILLAPEIQAESDSVLFNYIASEPFTQAQRSVLETRACRSLTDPIKVRLLLDKVDSSGELISLKINGKEINTVIEPFKEGVTFIKPFEITSSSNISGQWVTMSEGTPKYVTVIDKSEPYCFSILKVSVDRVYPLGLIPIFPGSPFHYLCIGGDNVERKEGPVFDPDKGEKEAPDEVKNEVNVGNKLYFYSHTFYKKGTPRKILIGYNNDAVPLYHDLDNPIIQDVKDVNEYNQLFPYFNSVDAIHTFLTGSVDLLLSERNVQSVELTVSQRKDGKSASFKWNRVNANDENTLNILRLALSDDTGLVKPASGQSDAEDIYLKNGFYTSQGNTTPNTFYRGTLVTSAGLNEKYASNITPLSLSASTGGDINLVNTDSITLRLKRDDAGNYTAWFYGQPLQFSDVIFAGKKVATAKMVRDTCY